MLLLTISGHLSASSLIKQMMGGEARVSQRGDTCQVFSLIDFTPLHSSLTRCRVEKDGAKDSQTGTWATQVV